MGHRRHAATVLFGTLLAAGLLTGCGSDSKPGSQAGSSTFNQPSALPSDSPSDPAGGAGGGSGKRLPGKILPTKILPGGKGGPAKSPSAPAGEMVLVGQVEAGVEGNCLVMQSGGKFYLLMGGDQNIVKPGNKVVVRGRVADVMSTCMQGQPFQVSEAHVGVSTTHS